MESEKLKDLILRSFQEAKKAQDSNLTPQDLHRKRSQEWVKVLAEKFRKYYNKDDASAYFQRISGSTGPSSKSMNCCMTLPSVEQAKRRLPKRGHA